MLGMMSEMNTEQTRELLEGFVEAWNARDVESIAGMLTDDAEFLPPRSIGRPTTGRDDVATALSGAAAAKFLDLDSMSRSIEMTIVEGAVGVVVLTLTADLNAGGEYKNRYCWVFECRDGAIATVSEFTDTNHAIRTFTGKK